MVRAKHSAKWDRCVRDVRRKGTSVDPQAVCTAALREMSYRRKNPLKDDRIRFKSGFSYTTSEYLKIAGLVQKIQKTLDTKVVLPHERDFAYQLIRVFENSVWQPRHTRAANEFLAESRSLKGR